jgi:serine protease Do
VAGSGVLISADGQVLTNWHVVDKAAEIRCLLLDMRAMSAKVIGTDQDTDLALIQLQMPPGSGGLPYADLGDSTVLNEGDFVMAMGAPWGLSRSVSIGVVSCTRRYLPGRSEYSLWLQTDASISPGNSGGPLVNTAGQVIGINALGAMMGGDMGFAVPSETIRQVIPQIREHGRVPWNWTGLRLQPIRDFERNMYFEGTQGMIVADTDADSPARRAGFQVRDRILSINQTPTNALTEEDLPPIRRMLGLLPEGKPIEFDVQRDGKSLKLTLEPRKKGSVQGDELDCPRWDLTVKTINQFENPDLYFQRKEGVFVFGVRRPGNAMTAGLQPQDILLKIGDHDVKTLADIKTLHQQSLDQLAQSHRVVVTVLRNGLMKQVVLDFGRDFSKE